MPNNNNNKKNKSTPRKANSRPKRRANNTRDQKGTSMQITNVPFQSAITVQQSQARNDVTLTASEYIGSVQVGGSTPTSSLQTFALSPSALVGTRLASMAKLYQRFRFVSAELLLNCNLSTATNGSLVVGYTSNVDWEAHPARVAGQVYSLPGAKSVRLWTPTRIKAVMTPVVPNAWYINDADSAEIMWANQGKFVVAIESQANLESITSIPVMLNYRIQFSLPVDSNSATAGALVFPQMDWTGSGGNNFASYTASTGETAAPAMVAKVIYELMPAPAVMTTTPGGTDLVPVVYAVYYTGKLYLYTLDKLSGARDYDINQAIQTLPAAWTTPRMVAIPV